MSGPLVSIIIPTKNRLALLLEAIESLRQQTYDNWEAIVVDDGSSDDTVACLLAMQQQESRVQVYRRESKLASASTCRNEGIQRSRGSYVLYLDSDDVLAPECLAYRVTIMEGEPPLDFAVFRSEVFRVVPGDVRLWHNIDTGDNDIDRFLCRDIVWQCQSPIWRRAALDRLGPWDEHLLSWQDWDFHMRALLLGFNYKKLTKRDSYWRLPEKMRGTIGGASRSPDHLRNQEYLFSKITALFRAAHLLDRCKRKLIAGNYLHFALLWEEAYASRAEAIRVWDLCRDEGLVSFFDYARIILYFKMAEWRGGWRVRARWRPKLGQWFPSLIGSRTMCCIPIHQGGVNGVD